jgi:TRAP-type C4-dicarboxylate transport system substrate-binding protein
MMRTILSLLVLAAPAAGAPGRLRMAGVAPEGTAWAREINAFAREVEATTHGEVKMKWYLGAIAGDEVETLERIRRDQLDGAGASAVCSRLAPSMRILSIPGLIRNWGEARHVVSRLFPTIEKEIASQGFVAVGIATLGSVMFFSRAPIDRFEALGKAPLFVWELDDVFRRLLPRAGVRLLPAPITDGSRLYEQGTVAGFVGAPVAALAFQWSARASHFTDLRIGFVPACAIIARRAFDALPFAHQQSIRSAGAKLSERMQNVSQVQESELIDRLFSRQGLRRVHASADFSDELYRRSEAAREQLGDEIVPAALFQQTTRWLAEYRSVSAK